MEKKLVVWFWEVDKENIGLVGGKGANLGEMVKAKLPVPPGFIITSHAYFDFLHEAKLIPKIKKYLKAMDLSDPQSLDRTSKVIKKDILASPMPSKIAKLIIKYYFDLGYFDLKFQPIKETWKKRIKALSMDTLVAVRSSATAEDLPTASFAGQQATFLNVKGEANLIESVRQCWASLFEPRAIFYRAEKGFDHLKVGIAVPVQKMIQAEKSGVMFTIDPVTGDKKTLIIEAIYGLGELIVQGRVNPDYYQITKKDYEIIKKEIGEQKMMLSKKGAKTREIKVPKSWQGKQKLTDKEILKIAFYGKKLEKHYYFPQDIEWAIEKGKIYILQTRPVTTIIGKKKEGKKEKELKKTKLKAFLEGDPASPGIGIGPAKIILTPRQINKVLKGDVLVTKMTNPDFVPAMKKVNAIVTEKGGRTSHAAIVSRELGIPCIVGVEKALKLLKTGLIITVDGGKGKIYKGGSIVSAERQKQFLVGKVEKSPISKPIKFLKTATKVYANLAQPERVKEVAQMNVDGIGLLRAEFMIADIGIHPKKIIKDKKENLYIDKLASQIAIFCSNFKPRPVVYRTTDFKTNEYRSLSGGKLYEHREENPMIGFRGASRYLADPSVFELELKAIKNVRNKMNLKNLWVMIPFVRTPQELLETKKIIGSLGLFRSPSFKLWLMVEIPSNVILLEDFIKVGIDGISIGSNDLTQLILGLDRDNSEIAHLFDENNKAVLWALEKVIRTASKYKITSSICGQAPSDYPDLVEKLVRWGITSVSVSPDAIDRSREVIYEIEKKLTKKRLNE